MKRLALPIISQLVDGFARQISYLRVSLTDRCNYRCSYCMPEEGVAFRARRELLTFEEIERVLRLFSGMGVRRVRLTGGEPTVRADVVSLVGRIAAIPGIESVVMTSNGHLFPELARPLREAGLDEVNISLDTLDPARFLSLTRRGDLARVLAGVDAAVDAGLVVKLNAVALRGWNDDEVADLCAYAWQRGVTPRFIEHMPMSGGEIYDAGQGLEAREIRERIEQHFSGTLVAESESSGHRGPARYHRLVTPDESAGERAATARRVGIISAMSEHFCDTCNRLRLSATGDLHACLAFDDAVSLREVMRGGGSDDDLRRTIMNALAGKREGHQFQTSGAGAPMKHMIGIGG